MAFFQKPSATDSSSVPQGQPALQPWIEKYRPKSMNDISSQEEAVKVLKKTIESHNLPHLLFYGPPGTGKTSTILALARELYGPEMFKTRVLELNASDERGIQIVREKVKNFARIAVGNPTSSYPCPPYKIVILDEADSMTNEAQSALRRTMETYSKVTRFCLICNYVSRIIEPLASRCAKFRFKPLGSNATVERLKMICDEERVQCTPEAITRVVEATEGDLRKAIMFLQSAHRLYKDDMIPATAIDDIAGTVPNNVIDQLFQTWFEGSYDKTATLVEEVVCSGHSGTQLLSQLHDRFVYDGTLTSRQKADIALLFGNTDKALCDGADEHLQILDLMVQAGLLVSA